MKRTPMPKRTAPLERRTRLAPGRTPLKQTRGRKCYAHLRDPQFKAWVREQGCRVLHPDHRCRGRVEFAHLKSEGTGGTDYGNGLGLCSGAHRLGPGALHMLGPISFQCRWDIDLAYEAEQLAAKYPASPGSLQGATE